MIDAKSFMEFFEKEFDVKFVDSKSGRNALDIIREKEQERDAIEKNCLTCFWVAKGDGVSLHKDDRVCVNADSEYVTEWVFESTVCARWKKAEAYKSVSD
jgi:hypothetical protein